MCGARGRKAPRREGNAWPADKVSGEPRDQHRTAPAALRRIRRCSIEAAQPNLSPTKSYAPPMSQKFRIASAALALSGLTAIAAATAQNLPAGNGKEMVETICQG